MKRVMCLYPEDYASMLRVAQEEIDTDARPALAAQVENMADYDVVFIGYPIWHGRMPQAIHSFIESHDLTGKTVIPFNTHEGSGQSGTQQVIENALAGSTVLQGLAIQGKTAQEDPERTRALIEPWLEGMNMRKANTGAEAEVLAAYEAIQQAMIDKDIGTLDRLYQDGTTFTRMSGKVQTKAEFFGEIADGTLNYYAYEIRNLHITVDGGEAILTASVTLTAKVYGEFINDLDPSTVHFPRAESIRGGEVIDLGEKKLSVVEIPGHTAGSIMLLDPDEKICFSGDAIIEHLWMFLEESLPPEVAEDDAGQQAMTETQPEPEQEQPVAGQTTIRVLIKSSGGKVNIRTGNGMSYSRITSVAPGTTLEYVASAFNGWQAVKIGSQVRWVSGEYSEITSE